MRKIILSNSVSVDGYFEGPDRDLSWSRVDEELHGHFNDFIGAAGGLIEGRITFELMAESWPTADQDPDSTPTTAEFAGIWRDLPKYVFSRTLTTADWNSTVISAVVPEHIAALKAEPGGDLVMSGADLAASLIRHGLIDEYRFYVHPVVLGEGRRVFDSAQAKPDLTLAETKVFGNGVVLLRYGTADGSTPAPAVP
jgi:dihydrofolate reductase